MSPDGQSMNDGPTIRSGGAARGAERSAACELKSGSLVFRRYRVERPLDSGGMGAVFLATDVETKLGSRRRVVLKVLRGEDSADEKFRKRFTAEADVLSEFKDERIALLYDFGIHGNLPVLVMEYVEGENLEDWLKRNAGKVDEDACRRLLMPVAEALDLAHKRQIYHLDVKPRNIIVRSSPRNGIATCLVDFGIARRGNGEGGTTGIWGTRPYMAPEACAGAPPSASMDVFSLAATAYECVSGVKAFPRGWNAATGIAPLPAETPFSFSVMQALSGDPEERPSNCAAVLDPSLDDSGAATGEIRPKRRKRRFPPPEPENLMLKRTSENGYRAIWDWPEGLEECVWAVLDRPAESLADVPKCERRLISRGEYESRGGIPFDGCDIHPESRFAVFGVAMCFGRTFEAKSHAEAGFASRTIEWRVVSKRAGWRFWARRSWLLVKSSDGEIPALELRAAGNAAAALQRGSSRRIAVLGPGSVGGSFAMPLDGKARRGEFLRLLMSDEDAGGSFLKNPPQCETEVG